jgi:tetratricopeptide (TPR) repeat protein
MRLCRARSVVALITLLAPLLSGNAWAQIGRVGGVVKDEGGQSLKGATITAENSNIGQSFTATTDDKGRFTMIGLRAGLWRFIAQAPGFTPEGGSMPVRMGAPNPPISFVLKKGGVANFGPLGGITAKDLQTDLAAADAAFDQGRWDEAIEAYRNVMSKSAALSVINLQIAAAYQNKKDYPAALASYQALLKLDPDNQKAHLGIAATNVQRGDEKAAEEALQQAARAPSAGREVFFTLGERKFAQNDTDEAALWYRKAADVDPFWGKPIYKLGLCAMKSGDKAGAASLMAQVILVDPVSPEATLAKSSLESLKK